MKSSIQVRSVPTLIGGEIATTRLDLVGGSWQQDEKWRERLAERKLTQFRNIFFKESLMA